MRREREGYVQRNEKNKLVLAMQRYLFLGLFDNP